jgi:hypothetical protein
LRTRKKRKRNAREIVEENSLKQNKERHEAQKYTGGGNVKGILRRAELMEVPNSRPLDFWNQNLPNNFS